MNGPLETVGCRFWLDLVIWSTGMVAKMCAGMGATLPSAQEARNGAKGWLRWNVIDRLSADTVADWIKLKPTVLPAPNLGLSHVFQVKSTSLASSGCPSDHLRPGRSLKVQVFRSGLTSPFCTVGSSLSSPG